MADFPDDFYARKFDVIVTLRGNNQQPKTLEDFLEAMNLQAAWIQTLSFFVSSLDVRAFAENNPTNLQQHFEHLSFLIMCFAQGMVVDDEEYFMKEFGLTKKSRGQK